jgi:purine-binding chemotaxis protein CheW
MKKTPTANDRPAAVIDWSHVHHRLEAAQAAVQGAAELTPEEKKRILKSRAIALAKAPTEIDTAKEHVEILEFGLASERYGIESSYIREVYPLKELTPLPGTPAFVLGVFNMRGQIISVLDIKKFFDLPEKGLTDLNKVIILHSSSMEFGILADVILGVRSVPLQDIQSSLPTLTGIREDYLNGVTKERLVILDAGKLLSDERIVVHEEVERIHKM